MSLPRVRATEQPVKWMEAASLSRAPEQITRFTASLHTSRTSVYYFFTLFLPHICQKLVHHLPLQVKNCNCQIPPTKAKLSSQTLAATHTGNGSQYLLPHRWACGPPLARILEQPVRDHLPHFNGFLGFYNSAINWVASPWWASHLCSLRHWHGGFLP